MFATGRPHTTVHRTDWFRACLFSKFYLGLSGDIKHVLDMNKLYFIHDAYFATGGEYDVTACAFLTRSIY